MLGKSIEHEDQIDYILGGFPEEYKLIADQLEGRENTPIVIEAHDKLLNKVAKLLTASTETAPVPVTANVSSAQTQSVSTHTAKTAAVEPQSTTNNIYQK